MLLTKSIVDELVVWLRDQLGDRKAVIGISGGKDSTVVAALCVKAVGAESVIGVLMPNGEQADIEDSKKVCQLLGINAISVNINDIYAGFTTKVQLTDQAKINLAPRIRMTLLYAISQSHGGRVINTSNASEAYVGWATKWGDNVGDIAPILNFTKTEVVEIGKILGLPRELIEKAPADGLTGKSDEDNFGFTYEELDKFIREPFDLDPNKEKFIHMHQASNHKRDAIPSFRFPKYEV